MRNVARYLASSVVLFAAIALQSAHADVVKIAVIDPASGPFAAPSLNWTKSMQFTASQVNLQKMAGNHRLEVVHFDNKGSTQEALVLLRTAIDQGYRYFVNGGSSSVYAALSDAITKHNERNPGKEVLLFTHSNGDPELNNSKCSFWTFRYVPNSDMFTEGLTDEIAKNKSLKKLYIIGQNYPLGQAVSKSAREYLKRKRPDIEIVGDDLHPMGQVKDFSPYIAKIKASGADAVITANWGADLTLLVKAANDANLPSNFYTFYANSFGVPLALGTSAEGRVKNITAYTPNNEGFSGREIVEGMKKQYAEDFIMMGTSTVITALAGGIKAAGSVDPVKVAFSLEGAKFKGLSGEVEMRKIDHQLQSPLFITSWSKTNGKDVKYDQDNTGYGWKVERKIEAYVAAQPTSCQMTRPTLR